MKMKNLFLIVLTCLPSILIQAQVAFTIVSPASISGGYEFTSNGDAPNWGLPNLNNPADAILDTVVIYQDTSSGINAQGVPHANEGCAPAINNLAGKIALIYRYDGASTNDCYAGTKVLNAQNAGAIGVILVNRVDGVYGYNGTTDGPLTTIPFAFIGKTDGAIIRAKIENGEDVVAFIGNKLGLFNDDIGIVKEKTIAPTLGATAALTSMTQSEFGFDIGTKIFNYGNNTQSGIILTATVNGPSGNWTQTTGPFTLATGDSVDVFTGGINSIPAFSMTSYPAGNYELSYAVSLGNTDESAFDNDLTYNFVINQEKISYSKTNPVTNLPVPSTFTRSVDPNFSACMVYKNENANRLAASGMYFATEPGYNTGVQLDGEEFGVSLYEWNDNFIDLNDAAYGFTNLSIVANGSYTFGPNQESTMVFAPFNIPLLLQSNQRYLACVDVWNDNFWIGFSNRVDYSRNIDHYLQPLAPVSSNSTYYTVGFGSNMVPSIALGVFDASTISVNELTDQSINIYPNPANKFITIEGAAAESELQIIDLSSRTVASQIIESSLESIDLSEIKSGHYFMKFTSKGGSVRTVKFSKL
jgi:hypothetical protein